MGHYYQQLEDGEVTPRHFVPMTSKPDQLRPTRITDVKKWWKQGETIVPSVTTVMNVLAKHALVNWKIDQHLKVAHQSNALSMGTPNEGEYIREIKRLTEMEMDKAPSAGTDFHELMEKYVLGDVADMSMDDRRICWEVKEVIGDYVFPPNETHDVAYDSSLWITEQNFVSSLGYGGQVDLKIPVFSGWIIDYKTKQTAEKFKPGKMVYEDHKTQLAAYREGVGMPNARCANVFVCLEDGQIDFHEHSKSDLEYGWERFQLALALWHLEVNKG